MADALERARNLLGAGRHADAVQQLTAALARAPEDADVLALLGFCLVRDDPAEALRYADRAIAADPTDDGGYEARAHALRELGRAQAAAQAASEAVRIDPHSYELHCHLAVCLYDTTSAENVRRARRHVDIALSLAPDEPEVHFVDGLIHARMEETAAARDAFTRVLAEDPEYTDAQRHLAWLDLKQGRTVAAIRGFAATMRGLRGGKAAGPFYLNEFHGAVAAWWWQWCYRLGILTLLTAMPVALSGPAGAAGLALGCLLLVGCGWLLRRSWAGLPPAARHLLSPGWRRRAGPALVAAALAGWLIVVLTVTVPPPVAVLVPGMVLLAVFLARMQWRMAARTWPELWRELADEWRLATRSGR